MSAEPSIESLVKQNEELKAVLWRFVSRSGHTHGCSVTWSNAPECNQNCIEVRKALGITEPWNPYTGKGPNYMLAETREALR